MAKKKQTEKTEEQMMAVEGALSKTEQFIENNSTILSMIVGAIVVVVLGYFAFTRYYLQPKEQEASTQIFVAERYFEQDSLNLALNGDGQYPGFVQISEDYGMTKTGNLANYYAGVSYLKLGEYEKALDYLNDFDGEGDIVEAWAMGKKGDAYMEMGEVEKAVDYYEDAANLIDNEFSTPHFLMKAGMTYETLSKNDEALAIYKKIQKDYPQSKEARSIERYIARVKG
ncbi:MAG TPA: tetratricopeptide repeat protein [Bacteroidales bacterium]|nr:tetratricopeptide repeat protein [Bacteroidales bacterium]